MAEVGGAPSAEGDPAGREADLRCLMGFAAALQAPVLVPFPDAVGLVPAMATEGLEAMVWLAGVKGVEPDAVLDGLVPGVAVAWEADPTRGELAERGSALLARLGGRLRHIVLRGGGPEATEQEGRGVGSLMARLAVAGYGGTVALAPSSDRYRVIWDAWLGRRGGWGCGSRLEDRSLVTLGRDA